MTHKFNNIFESEIFINCKRFNSIIEGSIFLQDNFLFTNNTGLAYGDDDSEIIPAIFHSFKILPMFVDQTVKFDTASEQLERFLGPQRCPSRAR
jgi:hypothetical protein